MQFLNSILEVKNLKTYFYMRKGVARAVDDVSLTVNKSDVVGLVGESGCGKSVTALSILKLVPDPPGKIKGGQIFFEKKDLLTLNEKEMRKIRGRKISMIFQDPLTSLDPVAKIGDQIVEAIRAHNDISSQKAWEKAIDTLAKVGITDAEIRAKQYPFQLSGGMRQRVMIAIALVTEPSLLIADEPTTNLDVTIQAQILSLIKDIKTRANTSILFITHNLGIVAWLCNVVYVMYAGKIVEYGLTKNMFKKPLHPYTQLLLNAVPRLDISKDTLQSIEGDVPDLVNPPSGCRFHPRCPYAKKICSEVEPNLIEAEDGQYAACLIYDKEKWDKT
ncbi:MAG: ABC transporter ATP-binding protein [Nitrososphaerales archaeon]